MKNISKREKIILAVVAIAVLYFMLDTLILRDSFMEKAAPSLEKANVERELKEIDELVSTVSATLKECEITEAEAFVIEQAGLPWPKDPFFVGMPTEQTEAVSDEDLLTSFTYTGFIEMGDTYVAIINGVDYRVGEELEQPGFVLQSVTPHHVVIEHTELKQRITVPFMEEY